VPLFLTSLVFDDLNTWLDDHHAGADVAVIGNASHLLDDGDAIVQMACSEIAAGGRQAHVVDVTRRTSRGSPGTPACRGAHRRKSFSSSCRPAEFGADLQLTVCMAWAYPLPARAQVPWSADRPWRRHG
jgi:hypothetical protein